MSGLAILGWIVIAAIAAFCTKQAFNIFRFSMAFMGKPAFEFYVMAVVAIAFIWLGYYTMPFHITLDVVR